MTLLVPAMLALSLAAAPTGTVAVVDVDSPSSMVGLAGQVTREVVQAGQAQKLTLLAPDQLRAKMDSKAFNALVKCAAKAPCVASALSGFPEISFAVAGVLSRDERNYKLSLFLINVKTGEVTADIDRSILIASRRFQKDVEQAVPGLLRGEKEARGTLKVSTPVKNVVVTVNGDVVGTAPITVQLKQGKYEITLTKAKYLDVRRLVDIDADRTTSEEIRMILMPGQTDEDLLPPLTAKNGEGPAADTSGGFHPSIPTFICGGVTIAAAALGIGFGLKASSADKALVASLNPATNRYGGTRADALGIQRDALIANVGFGIAGAAAVATAVFVFLDIRNGNTPAVEVAPTANAGGGGFVIGGSF